MNFRVTARTILQLGAELISSDAVAFYELIKNAFDAQSPRVDIDVIVRLPVAVVADQRKRIAADLRAKKEKKLNASTGDGDDPDQRQDAALLKKDEDSDSELIEERKNAILEAVDATAPDATSVRQGLAASTTGEMLLKVLDEANFIEIRDTGDGMSLDDLRDIYLTIGTRSRLRDRELLRQLTPPGQYAHARPILGEKGLGRLSAMRLGWRLTVETTKATEPHWNVLEVDWRDFSHESEKLVEEIEVSVTLGAAKTDPAIKGTRIRVSALSAEWSPDKLKQIAIDEFSKLTDPFVSSSHYPISLRFNDATIVIPAFDRILFDHAHASVQATFSIVSGAPALSGQIQYLMRGRTKTFSLGLSELISVAEATSPTALSALGPFEVQFYWFNRQALSAIDGIGDRKRVLALQNQWAGGLMVFRDGFRVNPYGSPDDDWLDLDRRALASAGYKVNRRQIIGRVGITSLGNPALLDQTNREGLRDCEEKAILIRFLKHIMEAQFRTFLNQVDAEIRVRVPVTFDDLRNRVRTEETQVRSGLDALIARLPAVRNETEIVGTIESSIGRINELMAEAQGLADEFQRGRGELLNLAGNGMMVEIVAHELHRATNHTLSTLADADRRGLTINTASLLNTLEAQLKTLEKRLRILDPLSTSGRQTKENFDLIAWVEENIRSFEGQFRRHGIQAIVEVIPSRPPEGMPVKMVKGMILQVLGNLLSNSVYWLKQQRRIERTFEPQIKVVIDRKSRTVSVTDNGPGVASARSEEIFQPFVTSKPPGEGKGLGLYIAREIANYHGGSLSLAPTPNPATGRLNTFVFTLGNK